MTCLNILYLLHTVLTNKNTSKKESVIWIVVFYLKKTLCCVCVGLCLIKKQITSSVFPYNVMHLEGHLIYCLSPVSWHIFITMRRQYKTIVFLQHVDPTTTFSWHPQSPAKASSARQTDRRTTCARIVSARKAKPIVTHHIRLLIRPNIILQWLDITKWLLSYRLDQSDCHNKVLSTDSISYRTDAFEHARNMLTST